MAVGSVAAVEANVTLFRFVMLVPITCRHSHFVETVITSMAQIFLDLP